MIHSGHRVAEQLAFALDVCHTIGSLADKLAETESDNTIKFISPMSSSISLQHRNMMSILPGVYCIEKMQFSDFQREEKEYYKKLLVHTWKMCTLFIKYNYYNEVVFHSFHCDKGKRNSSVCSYNCKGKTCYGVLQKFCFSPPLALIKPFKLTNKFVLQQIANPDCQRLNKYISSDLITCFIVEVQDNLLPVCVIPISDLKSKCIHVSVPSHSYVIVIPNSYEHH